MKVSSVSDESSAESGGIKKDDIILTTVMEHHSNLLPWRRLAKEKGARVEMIPVKENGDLDMTAAADLINDKVKLLTFSSMSNVLGTINPVKELIDLADSRGIPVCVDGAQSVVHQQTDVTAMGCSFFVFSSHKLYAPSGVGVLYIAPGIRDQISPYQVGGGMVLALDEKGDVWKKGVAALEAGTPNIAGVLGLGSAITYLSAIGMESITAYDTVLTKYGRDGLSKIPGVKNFGEPGKQGGVLSFSIEDIHAHDIAQFLAGENIAVRAGQHCASLLLNALGQKAVIRIGFGIYNNHKDIDRLLLALEKAKEFFKHVS